MAIYFQRQAFWGTILVGAFALPTLVSCANPTPTDVEGVGEQEDISATLESDEADTINGEAIALYGQFESHVGGTVFLLEETGNEALGNVLVVNSSDRAFAVPADAGTPMWAVGTILPLDPTTIDGIDPAELEAYAGKSAVYAERITLAPDPARLTTEAETFYNQDVTVYGEVEQVEAENTFILKDPDLFEGKGVIVIQTGDAALPSPIDDTKVAVSGILRPYVIAELEEEYELTWDLNLIEQLEAEYSQLPVLVADLITLTDD
mgnify:FL=1